MFFLGTRWKLRSRSHQEEARKQCDRERGGWQVVGGTSGDGGTPAPEHPPPVNWDLVTRGPRPLHCKHSEPGRSVSCWCDGHVPYQCRAVSHHFSGAGEQRPCVSTEDIHCVQPGLLLLQRVQRLGFNGCRFNPSSFLSRIQGALLQTFSRALPVLPFITTPVSPTTSPNALPSPASFYLQDCAMLSVLPPPGLEQGSPL